MLTNPSPGDTRRPTERDAALAVRAGLGVDARAIERLTEGICHYVYDVTTTDGLRVVARLATDETRDALTGGVYWHERLRDVGVPLARLLHADLAPASGFPYMLLERLPGKDLGLVYKDMTQRQRRALAADIVALQRSVATLPRANGYGFARSYEDRTLRATWLDVVLAEIERSRLRLAATGAAQLRHVERVWACALGIADYLRAVAPIPFLDDTTTKNTLVYQGALSGVVDTDSVCFGDPLFTLALTQMALLAHDLPSDYTDHWRDLLALTPAQQRALTLYTAVFCLTFMSEVGQRFNRDTPLEAGDAYMRILEETLDRLLASAGAA